MPEGASQSAPSRELLLASHAFPGEYIVKAFGPGTDEFRQAVHAVTAAIVGAQRLTSTERSSRSARRICITLVLDAQSVDDVIAVYHAVAVVPELMMLL
jgi:putative lipoic acid-binding regulatory protein